MEEVRTPQQVLDEALKNFQYEFAAMLERAGREYGESSTEWLEKIELFFIATFDAFIRAEIEYLESMKKERGTQIIVNESVTSIDVYNMPIDDQIVHLEQLRCGR